MSKRSFESSGLFCGDCVRIQGLAGAADLNGKVGKIVKCPDEPQGRYVVELQPGMQKSLKLANLSAYMDEPAVKNPIWFADIFLSVGNCVQIRGLTGAADLNGKVGKIIKCPDEPQGRYLVELEPGMQKSLKLANLSAYMEEPAVKNPRRAADGVLAVGNLVQIQGLTGAADLNGKVGKIIKYPDEPQGRYLVEIEPGMQKSLKLANLSAHMDEPAVKNPRRAADGVLAVGNRVQIRGLTGAADLNGKVGKIIKCPDEPHGRYLVELEPGMQKSLKLANISACDEGHASNTGPSAAADVNGRMGKMVNRAFEEPATREDRVRAAREEREKHKEERRHLSHHSGDFDDKKTQFNVGDRVRVGGLNSALELNGQVAFVFGLDKPSARYVVEFENGQGQKKLQGSYLTKMGVATGALAAKARMFAQMNGMS